MHLEYPLGDDPGILRYTQPGALRAISFKNKKEIAVINVKEKRLELLIKTRLDEPKISFRVFGKHQNQVVSLTRSGYLFLHIFNYSMRKLLICHQQRINLLKAFNEQALSLEVCDQSQLVLVQLTNQLNCSRMLLFQLDGKNVVVKAAFDQHNWEIGLGMVLTCYGPIGGHILWVGVTQKKPYEGYLFDFDAQEGVLRELEDQRLWGLRSRVIGICCQERRLYYSGGDGKVMKINISC